MTNVLIVDDDPVELRRAADLVAAAGYTPILATGGDEALRSLRADPDIAAVVLDLVMPDRDGMAVMEAMSRQGIALPVIVLAAPSAPETVASALRQGAADFVTRPATAERLAVSLRNALHRVELESALRGERAQRTGALALNDVVSRSPAMHRVPEFIRKAAKSALPVLLEGESGTGKTLVARIVHGLGDRAARPFVVFDCAAMPLARLDAALFAPTSGALARADSGTLLLRGLADLPADLQTRLVRVLETGELAGMPGDRPRRLHFRLIVASRGRLLALAQAGGLREDLFYRLNVLPLYLPPLRDRREDIAPLATHVIARAAAELQRPPISLSPEALALLCAYDWPHNVRQLETALHRAVALAGTDCLEPADFPQILSRVYGRNEAAQQVVASPVPSAPVHIDAAIQPSRHGPSEEQPTDRFVGADGEILPLEELERALIAFALERHGGHMSRVARALGIGRSTLYRKLRDYGLDDGVETRAA